MLDYNILGNAGAKMLAKCDFSELELLSLSILLGFIFRKCCNWGIRFCFLMKGNWPLLASLDIGFIFYNNNTLIFCLMN